ncbi:hypothetical protein [Streptomyces sp. NPDC050264]|uniref:hypothetical protein n=1 Tax=Streptomyces sp. NPDC050264 TaxID=3155038 RepID=UPI0034130E77
MERTQPTPTDVALRRLLEQPTYAAQTATVTARLLEMDPAAELTRTVLERGIDIAADTVLGTLPGVVSRESLAALYATLPPLAVSITRGEYAIRLRAAARSL